VADSAVVLFDDDFESDNGWTVYGDASDGHWERGIPVVEGTVGSPLEDYDGSGSCYLTGNEAGDSDVDDGTTYLVSPTIDLAGADGIVSFAAWWDNRCSPNGIAGDMMYIHISNDGGSSWEFVKVIGPNPAFESLWEVHEFVVSDFVEPTSELQVRFRISDDGLVSCVEAAIDAFRVETYVCECCSGLAGNLDDDPDGNVDIGDLTALISYLYIPPNSEPNCFSAANIDGDVGGIVDIGDLTALISYLYIPPNPDPAACQ
jgi:hypothetical protein